MKYIVLAAFLKAEIKTVGAVLREGGVRFVKMHHAESLL